MNPLHSTDVHLVPTLPVAPTAAPSAWFAATVLGVPVRPLQFPSLEHLDARVAAALAKMQDFEALSPRTIRHRRETYRHFRAFLRETKNAPRFLGGDLEQQVRVVEEYVAFLRAKNLARATVNGYWRGLRALFERLRRDDGMANPLAFLKAPRPGRNRFECLTPDAAERIVAYVQNEATVRPEVRLRNAAIVGVMLLAGLRRRECLALRVSDVDFEARVIRIAHGKGPDGGTPRAIPMTHQLFRLLRAYGDVREKMKTGAVTFFVGTHGRTDLSEATLVRIFRRVSARTGIHVSPHMLRHTFCTLLSLFGVPDRLAREAMGHADLSTLQRYQHVYEGELAASMEKLALDITVPGT